MAGYFQDFMMTFVPLFIVIDALGNLLFVIALSEGMAALERRQMVRGAIVTAAVVGLVFLFFGQFILMVMNISVGAFAIAGGILLLVLSIRHVLTGQMVEVVKEEMVHVVPIGTPLTVGPATITTLLLLVTQFPLYMVLISFTLNMVIAWGIFGASGYIARFMGLGGLKAVSKVFSLLLAAIAVNMVLHGFDLIGIIEVID